MLLKSTEKIETIKDIIKYWMSYDMKAFEVTNNINIEHAESLCIVELYLPLGVNAEINSSYFEVVGVRSNEHGIFFRAEIDYHFLLFSIDKRK